MKKAAILTLLFLSIAVLVSCVTNEKKLLESGAQLLTQQDLLQIFSEKRVAKFTLRAGNAVVFYFPDGTQRAAWQNGEDEGEYRIENGLFCSKWKKVRSGKEECYKIYRSGDNEFNWVKLNGRYDSTMAFEDKF